MTEPTAGSDDEFTCAECGGTFAKTRTDEEAIAEAAGNVPAFKAASDALRAAGVWTPADEDLIVICDDCYQVMAPPGGWPADDLSRRAAGAEIHSGTAGGIVFDAGDTPVGGSSATLSEMVEVWVGEPAEVFHATLDDNAELQRAEPGDPGAFVVLWSSSGIATIEPAEDDGSG